MKTRRFMGMMKLEESPIKPKQKAINSLIIQKLIHKESLMKTNLLKIKTLLSVNMFLSKKTKIII